MTDLAAAEQHLRSRTTTTVGEDLDHSVIDRDLATASYRAGLAAGGLDVDWWTWLFDRANQWPDKARRDYQLDLMTLEPRYRDTVQHLPIYWR